MEEYSVREEKSNIKMLVRKRASFRSSPKGRASPGTHVRVLRSRAVQLREPGAQAGWEKRKSSVKRAGPRRVKTLLGGSERELPRTPQDELCQACR